MPGTVGRQLSTLWLFVVLTTAWVAAVALFAIGEALWASAVLLAATLHLRARVKAMRRVRSVRRRWSPEVGARARRPTKAAPKATVRIGRDPATGRIDGVVLAGPHAGLGLRALPLDSLLAVAGTIDSGDVAALEHMTLLLDELHPGWSADAEPAAPDAAQAELSAARSLLGVEAGATQEEICAAHRRLIRRVHPDVGGSAALTAEVNAAKDLLLSVA